MKQLICIVCPKGCRLSVDEANGFAVTGNTCPRGADYGYKEATAPTRVLTSIVPIRGAAFACCPVKTSTDVPKAMIPQVMAALQPVVLQAPVAIGDIVLSDVCGTGAAWIATRNLPQSEEASR